MSRQNETIAKADVDLLRYLSELAKQSHRPGQTLQSRLNELRREYAS